MSRLVSLKVPASQMLGFDAFIVLHYSKLHILGFWIVGWMKKKNI